ncbi:MAG: hypothetical protein WAV45_02015 [Propionibacteriaceae bacterium]|nr:hypothetical protein [Propionibacteriaceae bacterium]
MDSLLTDLDDGVREVLSSSPTVLERSDPDLNDIKGAGSSTWLKIPDVVAVVADLRNSSRLGTGRHDVSTAKIYQSSVDGAVKVFHDFDANFIDIQGDGGFGLFWGQSAYERAFCAAVTVRSFSSLLVKQLESKYGGSGSFPETGYKVGMAADRVLVKTIGSPRDVAEQEAVWPGRAVNHAVKCAQSATRHQIVVTESLWNHFKENDFVTTSCGCSNGVPGSDVTDLWKEFEIEHIHDEDYRHGYVLESPWCKKHGAEFCSAILAGETTREITEQARRALQLNQMRAALETKRVRRNKYPR